MYRFLITFLMAGFSIPALAHPFHGAAGGAAAGFIHPFTGLDHLLAEGLESGRLSFTDVPAEGVEFGLLQFIAVGTPPDEDGSADLQYVLQVARTIGEHMNSDKIVVDKSTVPVGTADQVRAAIAAELEKRGSLLHFDVVSNPEFLKEGSAVEDFAHPDRISRPRRTTCCGAERVRVSTRNRQAAGSSPTPLAILFSINYRDSAVRLFAKVWGSL